MNLRKAFVLLVPSAVYVGSCVPKFRESLSKNKIYLFLVKIYLSGKRREDIQEMSPLNYGGVKR